LLSDRPFCRFCASATVLKWVQPVTSSLSEGAPKRVIGADRLIPERMGIFGQDRRRPQATGIESDWAKE